MPILTAQNLMKSHGASVLLEGAELHLARGEKVGLVGRNGTGKSTLLKILAGLEDADSGQVVRRREAHVAYLAQDPPMSTTETLMDIALAGAKLCREHLDPHEAELRAEQALKGLGIENPHQKVSEASGGTRRRAALAAALLQQPDLLLLDEPTNHLDPGTSDWLQAELRALPGALVLVTHDRYFLNQVVDRIVELRHRKLKSYEGSFQDYLQARLDEDGQAERVEGNRRQRLRAELAWLGTSPAARSCKPKARMERARAAVNEVVDVEKPLQLPMFQLERMGKVLVDAKDLRVGWPDKTVIQHLTLLVTRGERIGIVGPNGAGKTTLLRTLLGEIPPLAGTVTRGATTQVMQIDQQRSGLEQTWTVREAGSPAGTEWVTTPTGKMHIAGYLEQFLFKFDDLRQTVATLSGGQRFRLLLARKLQEPMNLLVLDEPTNDLDFETLELLEETLLAWPGTSLIVSHDRAFLDRVCTAIIDVPGDGTATLHAGGWSDLQARKNQKVASAPVAAAVRQVAKTDAPPKLTFAEEKRLTGMEAEIEAAEDRVVAAEARLADGDITADYAKLQAAIAAQTAAAQARDDLWTEWQRLEEKQRVWLAWKNGG